MYIVGEHGLPIQYNQVCSKTEQIIDVGIAQSVTQMAPEIKNGIMSFIRKCPNLHPEDLQLLRKAKSLKFKRKKIGIPSVQEEEMKNTELKMDELNINMNLNINTNVDKIEGFKKKKEMAQKKRTDVNTVFIRNINKNIVFLDKEIQEIFDICNDSYQLRHQRNENGYSTGIAFIEFSTEEGFQKALKLNGVRFKNKNLVVMKSDREGHLQKKTNSQYKGQTSTNDKLMLGRKKILSEVP